MIIPSVNLFGDQFWYDSMGRYHRDGAPAIINADGSVAWYKHGKLHREDGPAVEFSSGNGATLWYLNNRRYDNANLFCLAADIKGKHKTLFLIKYAKYFTD